MMVDHVGRNQKMDLYEHKESFDEVELPDECPDENYEMIKTE